MLLAISIGKFNKKQSKTLKRIISMWLYKSIRKRNSIYTMTPLFSVFTQVCILVTYNGRT